MRKEQRLSQAAGIRRLLAAGVLAASVCTPAAFAEGGLPGSPVAAGPGTAPAASGGASARPDAGVEPGSAVFSPFVESAAAPPRAQSPAGRGSEAPAPDVTLTIAVALAGALVLAWFLRRNG
ncbi:hypothetical protein [Variovorax saccharolyticus]|uniref:hypothetical protein n=1 Tax=Variovorax saccharolyticus TaxID=3053516 RepID=UPI0025788370|nr:hypothetical protein [Variovorax sp. J31P216]MDM0025438.1 hypothetical protein [Variovorax sp. J31P216]